MSAKPGGGSWNEVRCVWLDGHNVRGPLGRWMMRSDEILAVGDLTGAVAGGGLALAADLHRAIADRAFSPVESVAAPVRSVHDQVSQTIWAGWAGLARRAPLVLAELGAAAFRRTEAPPVQESPGGARVVGAVNGFYGDYLAGSQSALAVQMSVRRRGRLVDLSDEAVADAIPDASPHLAVFVHGLCESDGHWHPTDGSGSDGRVDFGELLESELGATSVDLRYNSGRRVSDNGQDLDRLLESLVECWPCEVTEITLVGHSMGGLVARSACHYGAEREAGWTELVRHVVCLGTPHMGAPLEQAVNALSWVLGQVPEARGVAKVLNARSVGIKDLRFGSVRHEDWHDVDPDEFLTDRCKETPFLSHANYYFVGATVTRDRRHPLGAAVGDLLVQYGSASGAGRRRKLPFELEHGRHIGGVHHFDLLTNPDVADQVLSWLGDAGESRSAVA